MLMYCEILYCLYGLNKVTENTALLHCITITNYCKPQTVWSFLVKNQSDDRYTKYTEHIYTLSLGYAACVYTTVQWQIYVLEILVNILKLKCKEEY